MLRAIVAYVNILRAQEVLKFAERSEANIKRQTELENARVERGAGLSTDVLQAKQQLAGAQARRVRAQGALAVARNTYNTVFGFMPEAVSAADRPVVPASMVPQDIEEAILIALDNNFQLEAVNISNEIAGEIVETTRSSQLFPRFEAVTDNQRHTRRGALHRSRKHRQKQENEERATNHQVHPIVQLPKCI